MKTLFLHGFNSAPVNHHDDWLTLYLDYSDVERALNKLRGFIKDNNVQYIVAKSIGCYFALKMYHEMPNLTLFMINPSLKPYETLKHLNGKKIVNYRDEKIITEIPIDFTKKLKIIEPVSPPKKIYFSGGVFFEFGDEVVDQVENSERISTLFKETYEDGNHSFSRMKEAVESINTFINYDFI